MKQNWVNLVKESFSLILKGEFSFHQFFIKIDQICIDFDWIFQVDLKLKVLDKQKVFGYTFL